MRTEKKKQQDKRKGDVEHKKYLISFPYTAVSRMTAKISLEKCAYNYNSRKCACLAQTYLNNF